MHSTSDRSHAGRGESKVVRQVSKTFTRYFHKTSLCEVRGTSPHRKSACSYTQRRWFDPSQRPGGSDWHQISYVILRGNFSARATLLSDHLFWGNFAWLQLAGSRGKKETRNSPFYPLQTVSIQLRQTETDKLTEAGHCLQDYIIHHWSPVFCCWLNNQLFWHFTLNCDDCVHLHWVVWAGSGTGLRWSLLPCKHQTSSPGKQIL